MGILQPDTGLILPEDPKFQAELDELMFGADVAPDDGEELSDAELMALMKQELEQFARLDSQSPADLPAMQSGNRSELAASLGIVGGFAAAASTFEEGPKDRRSFLTSGFRGAVTALGITALMANNEAEASQLPMPKEKAKGRTPAERVKERENLSDEVRMREALDYMSPQLWDTPKWKAWADANKKLLLGCLKARKTDDWKRSVPADRKETRKSFAAECSAYGDVYTTVPADGFPEEISSKSGDYTFHVFNPHMRVTEGDADNVELSEKYQKINYLVRRSIAAAEGNPYALSMSEAVNPKFTGKYLDRYLEILKDSC